MSARPVEQSLFPDHAPDKPVGPLPLSVQTGTNADLMWTIRDLYLTGSVLDVTYGEGGWWRRFQPESFTAHDLYKLDGVDFRALPEADRSVDTVCFDPPYVTGGGSSTTGEAATFRERFGIDRQTHYGWEDDLFRAVVAGLTEAIRVARAFVLVKCMEFTSSREFHDMPTAVTNAARASGCTLYDRIVHYTGTGPGGHNIWEAKRCRRAHSYLLVFAVPR